MHLPGPSSRRWALPCPDLPLRPHPKALELGNGRLCSLLNSYKEILFFMWPRSGPGDSKPSVRELQEAAAGPFRSSVLGGTRSRCDPAADVSPPCVFPASVFYSNELRVLGFVFFLSNEFWVWILFESLMLRKKVMLFNQSK